MSAESVAVIPSCAECEIPWLPADAERWQAYLTDGEPPELAFYCRVSVRVACACHQPVTHPLPGQV